MIIKFDFFGYDIIWYLSIQYWIEFQKLAFKIIYLKAIWENFEKDRHIFQKMYPNNYVNFLIRYNLIKEFKIFDWNIWINKSLILIME